MGSSRAWRHLDFHWNSIKPRFRWGLFCRSSALTCTSLGKNPWCRTSNSKNRWKLKCSRLTRCHKGVPKFWSGSLRAAKKQKLNWQTKNEKSARFPPSNRCLQGFISIFCLRALMSRTSRPRSEFGRHTSTQRKVCQNQSQKVKTFDAVGTLNFGTVAR